MTNGKKMRNLLLFFLAVLPSLLASRFNPSFDNGPPQGRALGRSPPRGPFPTEPDFPIGGPVPGQGPFPLGPGRRGPYRGPPLRGGRRGYGGRHGFPFPGMQFPVVIVMLVPLGGMPHFPPGFLPPGFPPHWWRPRPRPPRYDDDVHEEPDDDDDYVEEDDDYVEPTHAPVPAPTHPPVPAPTHAPQEPVPSTPYLIEDNGIVVKRYCENEGRPPNYLDMRKQIFSARFVVCVRNDNVPDLMENLSTFWVDVLVPAYVDRVIDCEFSKRIEIAAVLVDRSRTGALSDPVEESNGRTCLSWTGAKLQVNYYRRIGGRELSGLDGTEDIGLDVQDLEGEASDDLNQVMTDNAGDLDIRLLGFEQPAGDPDDAADPNNSSLLNDSDEPVSTSSTSANLVAIFVVVIACLFVVVVGAIAFRRRMKKQQEVSKDISTLSLAEPEIGSDGDEYYTDQFKDEQQRKEDEDTTFNETIYVDDEKDREVPQTPAKDFETEKEPETPDAPTGMLCC